MRTSRDSRKTASVRRVQAAPQRIAHEQCTQVRRCDPRAMSKTPLDRHRTRPGEIQMNAHVASTCNALRHMRKRARLAQA
eukprot:4821385-Pleurochrysis_carterae.AAC.2